jgi:hypothetical protein
VLFPPALGGTETFDISGRLASVVEGDEDMGAEVPILANAMAAAPVEGPAVEDLAADELINEDDLVLIHTGLRLDRMSTTKLMGDRLVSYPAPIWGSKLVM